MTLDWALPALRWALFADLGLVFWLGRLDPLGIGH